MGRVVLCDPGEFCCGGEEGIAYKQICQPIFINASPGASGACQQEVDHAETRAEES